MVLVALIAYLGGWWPLLEPDQLGLKAGASAPEDLQRLRVERQLLEEGDLFSLIFFTLEGCLLLPFLAGLNDTDLWRIAIYGYGCLDG